MSITSKEYLQSNIETDIAYIYGDCGLAKLTHKVNHHREVKPTSSDAKKRQDLNSDSPSSEPMAFTSTFLTYVGCQRGRVQMAQPLYSQMSQQENDLTISALPTS